MIRPLAFAAFAEAATGTALIVAPSLVARLLLGTEASGSTLDATRLLGVALLALGIACLPPRGDKAALAGMLTYSTLVALYLSYGGAVGTFRGALLWPAVALHAVLAVLLARSWSARR